MSTGTASKPDERARRSVRGPRRFPVFWLVPAAIVVVAFVVTAIWTRCVHSYGVMPDELGYVKQALQIAHTGRPLGPGDFYFSSWAQLLPAVMAPLFGTMGMVNAFYTAHTVTAFLLVSAAIPAFLLALELRLGRLAASLMAALTVGVPWLVFAGVVMTENLAYPLFLWAILAMLRALTQPSARRDVLAVVAIAVAFLARTQFFVLGPILVVSALITQLVASRRRGDSFRPAVAAAVGHHRVLAGITAVAGVALLAVAGLGSASTLLGNYSTATSGALLPHGWLAAGVAQLYYVALPIGLVPLTLAAAWVLPTVVRPRDPDRFAFAVIVALTVAALIVVIGSFQVRFVGPAPDERYMFYLAPLLFISSAAWVVDRRGSPLVVVAIAGLVVLLTMLKAIYFVAAFSILNPATNFQRVLIAKGRLVGQDLGIPHLDPRVVIVAVTVAFTLVLILVRARLRTPVVLLVTCLPLLGFLLAETSYAMRKIKVQDAGLSASSPRLYTWIDPKVPAGSEVGLVIAPSESEWNTWTTWWSAAFWNKSVQRTFVLPGGESLAQGFVALLAPDFATGRLEGLGPVRYLVKLGVDTRLGLPGSPLAAEGGLDLYRVTPNTSLTYATSGIGQDDSVQFAQHPVIRFFGHAPRERVTLTFAVSGRATGCPCALYPGSRQGAITLPTSNTGSGTVALRRTLNLAGSGQATLPLVLRGVGGGLPQLTVKLISVAISD